MSVKLYVTLTALTEEIKDCRRSDSSKCTWSMAKILHKLISSGPHQFLEVFIYTSSPSYFLNLVSPCHQCDTASQYFTNLDFFRGSPTLSLGILGASDVVMKFAQKKYSKLPIPCDTCTLDKGATRKAIHLRQILWCWVFLVSLLVDSFQWNQKRFHDFHVLVCSCGDV